MSERDDIAELVAQNKLRNAQRKQYADGIRKVSRILGVASGIILLMVVVAQPTDDSAPAPYDTKRWLIGAAGLFIVSLVMYFYADGYEGQS